MTEVEEEREEAVATGDWTQEDEQIY